MRGPVYGTYCHFAAMHSTICLEDFRLTYLIPGGFWRNSSGFAAHPNRTIAIKAAEIGIRNTENSLFMAPPIAFFQKDTSIA